jgi:hypothetical protein
LEIQKALSAAGLNTSITLTDRFPNSRAFQQVEEASEKQITFVRESVDARSIPNQLIGLRTIFNSFHHFGESDARKILLVAVKAGQPIAIFEYTERAVLIVFLTMILTPFLVALATPFIRPFPLVASGFDLPAAVNSAHVLVGWRRLAIARLHCRRVEDTNKGAAVRLL